MPVAVGMNLIGKLDLQAFDEVVVGFEVDPAILDFTVDLFACIGDGPDRPVIQGGMQPIGTAVFGDIHEPWLVGENPHDGFIGNFIGFFDPEVLAVNGQLCFLQGIVEMRRNPADQKAKEEDRSR